MGRTCRSYQSTDLSKLRVPPYLIFHDSTLQAMAELMPSTLEAFGDLPGVGTRKLDKYGQGFIDVIKQH